MIRRVVRVADPRVVEAVDWIDRYTERMTEHQLRLLEAIGATYEEVSDWRDTAQTIAATAALVGITQASRSFTAGMSAELASVLRRIVAGLTLAPLRDIPEYPRPVSEFKVYSRAIFAYRKAIEAGASPEEAFRAARDRAYAMALMDDLLTERNVALRELGRGLGDANPIIGWRRIIRPELSKTGTCGLCIAAADRIYKTAELMEVHDRCKCIVLPVTSTSDLADLINRYDYIDVTDDAGGTTRGRELKKVRYVIDDHGELGPVIRPARSGEIQTAA